MLISVKYQWPGMDLPTVRPGPLSPTGLDTIQFLSILPPFPPSFPLSLLSVLALSLSFSQAAKGHADLRSGGRNESLTNFTVSY